MIVADDPPAMVAAMVYAERGWRVVPIVPGRKSPSVDEWQNVATTDPTLIGDWWQRWPRHGVGIVTGEQSGLWVLDVDVTPPKMGDETLADLEFEHGPLPDTVEVLTPTGGRHIYFRWPGFNPGTGANKLGPGLDVRAEGGQVLAPPSMHPNGGLYTWEVDHHPRTTDVADAPDWLLDLLRTPTAAQGPSRERRPRDPANDGAPGNRWAETVSWPELLEADGATFVDQRVERSTGEPYELWSRPPMVGEDGFKPHTSATLYYKGSDVLKVFSPNWQGLDPVTGELWRLEENETYTKFGYYAVRHHGGSFTKAAAALRTEGHGDERSLSVVPDLPADVLDDQDEVDSHGWERADISLVLSEDYEPPVPTVLRLSNGEALAYAGRSNALQGESGCGKSWLAQYGCAQELADGHDALYVDLEDHLASVLARMRAMGVPDEVLVERFHYISPQRSWNLDAREALGQLLADRDVTIAVIDSTGEAMALDGAKPNDDDDTARWFRRIPRWIARRGPAVLLLDHLPKDTQANPLHAIGSQRKRAAIDGAAYRVDARVSPAKGRTGHLSLTVAKDRGGAYPQGLRVADVTMASNVEGTVVEIVAERHESVKRPTVYMERVSRFLEENGPSSQRKIVDSVEGKTDMIRKAIEVLVAEKYVSATVRIGRGGGHDLAVLTPFRRPDAVDSMNRAQPRPNRAPTQMGRGSETAPPAPHAFSTERMGGGAVPTLDRGAVRDAEDEEPF